MIQNFRERNDIKRDLESTSKAPIIVLDEFEKVKYEKIKYLIEQITNRDLNYDFYDNFFEYRLDLSNALIFLIASYIKEEAPDLLANRFKTINIPLLTYEERLQILINKKIEFIKEYFPANKGDKIISEGLTSKQLNINKKITAEFLKECITEEWGLRGSIMNLVSVLDFIVFLNVRQVLQELDSLED